MSLVWQVGLRLGGVSVCNDNWTGFDYHFNAIQNESDELFHAYKEMFEIAVSQCDGIRTVVGIYIPLFNELFVSCVRSFAFSGGSSSSSSQMNERRRSKDAKG